MSFFNTLQSLGLWPQQGQPQDNPYGLDDAAMRQARMQSLGNLGSQLLAASMPMTSGQRANLMQGFDATGGYQNNLYNAAQLQLLGDKRRQDAEEAKRTQAATDWLQQRLSAMPDSPQKQKAMIFLQLGDVQKAADAMTEGPDAGKPPEMKTVRVGDQDVTYQWDPARGWVKFGAGEAFKREETQSPSSVREYEYAKAQGYEGSYEDFLKMATAARAGVSIPAEVGARIGLGEGFITDDLPGIKRDVAAGVATGPVDAAIGWAGYGRQGEIRRRVQVGLEALLRNLTGAGSPASELARYEAMYAPSMLDTPETLMSKLNGLEHDLKQLKAGALSGKTGTMASGAAAAPETQPPTRLRYNPDTGELE